MLGGIPVQVRAQDLERAQAALRANKFLADSVDWDSVDVGEEDEAAKQLARGGMETTVGQFMVRGGRIAAVIIVVLSVATWLARCG